MRWDDDDDAVDAPELRKRLAQAFSPNTRDLDYHAPASSGELAGRGEEFSEADETGPDQDDDDNDLRSARIRTTCPHCGTANRLLPPKGWRFQPAGTVKEANAATSRHVQYECEGCQEINRVTLRKHVARRVKESETGRIFRRVYRQED